MAAYFETTSPRGLLTDFDKAIALGHAAGGIATWTKANGHYTHTSAQWGSLAFLKPSIGANRLTFNIVKPQNSTISVVTYGFYHGHIVETFLNHFDKQFTLGSATALPTASDQLV